MAKVTWISNLNIALSSGLTIQPLEIVCRDYIQYMVNMVLNNFVSETVMVLCCKNYCDEKLEGIASF
jgi:hypothetical protein